MKAVILAGGKGTRLAPFTSVLPKPMMPIGEQTILDIILWQASRSGIKEVTLAVGHLASLMQSYYKDGSQFGLKIDYAFESKPLGTAGPLAFVEGLDDTFMVCNGDILTLLDMQEAIAFHKEQGAVCTICSHQRTHKINLGVIQTKVGLFEVNDYIEKPSYDFLVSMGIYIFEPKVLNYIPKGEYFDFPSLVKALLAADEKVVCFPYAGYWRDLGNYDDYVTANEDFESMRSQFLGE
ncbi:MAG: NTP transferase domain-containing protein [Anaerolineaceae bacterium]|nr:NTP transferase domain-containing protein [Anaerolineaceae bacterium]